MNVFELTRALVDIESITENEERVGIALFAHLAELAARYGGHVERIPVEEHRFNVLAWWGDPVVTLSTHMDTVPPFFASREDETHIWGRGSCDTKGIIASMIFAAEEFLRGSGEKVISVPMPAWPAIWKNSLVTRASPLTRVAFMPCSFAWRMISAAS